MGALIARLGLGLIFGRLKSMLGVALSWVLKNPQLAAIIALTLALVLAIGTHERDKRRIALATARAVASDQARAISNASVDRLTAQIATQNAAVAQLGQASATARAQGAAALAATAPAAARRTSEATAIAATHATPHMPNCPTPAAVMAAKGDL